MPETLVRPEPSFEEAAEIQKFWEANYSRLLKQYPEQFVAVKPDTGEVVVADGDLASLVYKLRDLNLDPRTDVAIEFITAEARTLLL